MSNKPLSVRQSLQKGWRRFCREVLLLWRICRFEVLPTEKNLLLTFWYDFQNYKAVVRGSTIYGFLDYRVANLNEYLRDIKVSARKKQLRNDLLTALYNPRLRQMIVEYLERPEPEQHFQEVLAAMRSAWRTGPGENIALPKQTIVLQETVPSGGDNHALIGWRDEDRPGPPYAKTFVIAAEIHFELQGKRAEFKRLVNDVTELKIFVQEQFGVTRLPGTFKKLKGFSYRAVLDSRNDSRIGQLKINFRQIIENPDVFGEKIVEKAKKIAEDYFV